MKKVLLSNFTIAFLLLITVISVYSIKLEAIDFYERKLYDLRMLMMKESPAAPIVIIDIDDKSLKSLGSWPFPRAYIAHAVTMIRGYNPRVVGLHIVYSGHDPNPALKEIKSILKKIESFAPETDRARGRQHLDEIAAALKEAEVKLDNDSILAAALSMTDNVVLPLSFLFFEKQNGASMDIPYKSLSHNSLDRKAEKLVLTNPIKASSVNVPLEKFAVNVERLGFDNQKPDRDDAVRSVPLFVEYANRYFPSFSLQTSLQYFSVKLKDCNINKGILSCGDKKIPITDDARLLINYKRKNFAVYSFIDLLNGRLKAEDLTDKIVIIGRSEPARYKTASGLNASSLDIVAFTVGNIINENAVIRPAFALYAELAGMLLLAIIIALSLQRLRGIKGFAFIFLIVTAWCAASVFLFLYYKYWITIAYAVILSLVTYAAISFKNYLLARKVDVMETETLTNGELNIVVASRTDAGVVRNRNEDSFIVERDLGLLCVADGVGGHASGDIASSMAVDGLRKHIRNMEDSPDYGLKYHDGFSDITNMLISVVKSVNSSLYEASVNNPQWKGMSTTVSIALIRGRRLSLAHVGDSRIYLIRRGKIEQLTDDHTWRDENNPKVRHILTRALGINAEVEVDIDELALFEGDILLLCSDGLYTMVPESAMLKTVTSSKDPYNACTKLINEANKNGGKDNITVILAYVLK